MFAKLNQTDEEEKENADQYPLCIGGVPIKPSSETWQKSAGCYELGKKSHFPSSVVDALGGAIGADTLGKMLKTGPLHANGLIMQKVHKTDPDTDVELSVRHFAKNLLSSNGTDLNHFQNTQICAVNELENGKIFSVVGSV